jgi:hypothetical protein
MLGVTVPQVPQGSSMNPTLARMTSKNGRAHER